MISPRERRRYSQLPRWPGDHVSRIVLFEQYLIFRPRIARGMIPFRLSGIFALLCMRDQSRHRYSRERG
jgi:hypothetical protein